MGASKSVLEDQIEQNRWTSLDQNQCHQKPTLKQRLRSRLGSDTAITLAANVAIASLSLITGPLLARVLGVVGRGEIAAIQMFAMPLASLAMVGQMEATVYFSARDTEHTGKYVSTGLFISLVIGPFLCALAFWVLPSLLRQQSGSIIYAARWYLLLVPLYGLIYVPLQALRITEMRLWNVLRVLPNIAWLVAVICDAVGAVSGSTGIASAHLIGLALAVPVVFGVVARKVGGSLHPTATAVKPMLQFGVPSSLGTMSQWLNIRVDQLLMVVLLPTAGVGLYAVASGWSSALLPAFTALAFVALPRVASGRSEIERLDRFRSSVRRATLTGITLLVLGIPITPLAVPLVFGAAFKTAVTPTMILMLGIAVAGMNVVVEDGLRGLGFPGIVFASETIGWLSTAFLVFWSYREYGLVGIAASSLTGYILTLATLALFVCKKTKMPLYHTFVPTMREFEMLSRFVSVFKG